MAGSTLTDGLSLEDFLGGEVDFRIAPYGTDIAPYMTAAKADLEDDDPVFPILSYNRGRLNITPGFTIYEDTVGTRYTDRVKLVRRIMNTFMASGNFAQNNPKVRSVLVDMVPGPGGVGRVPRTGQTITPYACLLDIQGKTSKSILRMGVRRGQFTKPVGMDFGGDAPTNLPFEFEAIKDGSADLYWIEELVIPA